MIVGAIGNSLIYAGALSQAARVYRESITAAETAGNRLAIAWQSTMRAKASVRLGEIRRAEAEARLALRVFEEGSGEPGVAWCVAHLLDALLARGALDEAAELVDRDLVAASAAPTLPVALLRTSLAHFHLAAGSPPRAAGGAGRRSARVGNDLQPILLRLALGGCAGARPHSTVTTRRARRPRTSSTMPDDSASARPRERRCGPSVW